MFLNDSLRCGLTLNIIYVVSIRRLYLLRKTWKGELCHVTIDMTIMFKSGQDLRLSVLMCSIVNVLLCGDM